ncbi:MAG: DUF1858 domain-containing protein, partial [Christensenellales bacterium]
MENFKVTKDTILADVLDFVDEAEPILLGFGMHCLHCPHSVMETLEEACAVHEIDLDLVLEKLNDAYG